MIELPVGRTPPNGERAFIHKKILGVVGTVAGIGAKIGIPGAGFVATTSRLLGGRPAGGFVPRTLLPRGITPTSQGEKRGGALAKGLIPDDILEKVPCLDPRLVQSCRWALRRPGVRSLPTTLRRGEWRWRCVGR